MRSATLLSVALASVGLFACDVGSTDPNGPGGPGGGNPGGGVDAGAEPIPASCTVEQSMGAMGALGDVDATLANAGGGDIYRIDGDLVAGNPRDVLSISFADGVGIFAGGVAPGTYTITGADADYNTCALCVTVIGDLVPMVGPTQFYMAQSGTVTIDSVTPTLSVTLGDVSFAEMDLMTGALVGGGCQASLTSAELSGPLQ